MKDNDEEDDGRGEEEDIAEEGLSGYVEGADKGNGTDDNGHNWVGSACSTPRTH